jgi:hypothetical protein
MLLPFALTLAYSSLQCPRRSWSYLLLRRPSIERGDCLRQPPLVTTSPSCCLHSVAPGPLQFPPSSTSPSCRPRCVVSGLRQFSLESQLPCVSYCLVPFRSSSLFYPRRILPVVLIGQFPPSHDVPPVTWHLDPPLPLYARCSRALLHRVALRLDNHLTLPFV